MQNQDAEPSMLDKYCTAAPFTTCDDLAFRMQQCIQTDKLLSLHISLDRSNPMLEEAKRDHNFE